MKTIAVAVTVMASGCLSPTAELCGALLCPAAKTCAPGLELCVFPEQLSACATDPMAASCHFANSTGYCHLGVCLTPSCGNGVVEPPEVCDDGVNDGTSCSAKCDSDLRCGNGILDPHEDCDCGDGTMMLPFGCNQANADDPLATCSTSCVLRGCGDGVITVAAGEQCDPMAASGVNNGTCGDFGFYESTQLSCTAFCRYDLSPCAARCGDHIVNGREVCDGAPPEQSCLDYNYDAGMVTCQDSICQADVGSCLRAGWVRSAAPSPVVNQMRVYGRDDVYAVALDAIFHFDGSWKQLVNPPNSTFTSLWAFGPSDVYVVGVVASSPSDGVAFHWDGRAWTQIVAAPGTWIAAVWGSASNDVWFSGQAGSLWHYNGATATKLQAGPTFNTLSDMRGRAANDIYAIGLTGFLHYDGTSWSTITAPVTVGRIAAVLPNRVVMTTVTGVAWYDTSGTPTWTTTTLSAAPRAAWGNRADNLFAVGYNGQIEHWDGTSWRVRMQPFNDAIFAIDGDASGREVWAATQSWFLHYSGAEWQAQAPSGFATTNAITALQSGEVIVAGNTASDQLILARGTPGNWTIQNASAPTLVPTSVWASSATDIYLCTDTGLWRSNGSGFSSTTVFFPSCEGVWGVGASNIYAADRFGNPPKHWDGVSWTATGAGGNTTGIWGSAPNDVFTTTGDGGIWHWNGTVWVNQLPTNTTRLNGIWGHAANDVFVVGASGTIWHYDGASWTKMTVPTSASLRAVSGVSGSDVFAVSRSGTIVHYDGKAWTLVRLPVTTTTVSGVLAQRDIVYFPLGDGRILTLDRSESPWP